MIRDHDQDDLIDFDDEVVPGTEEVMGRTVLVEDEALLALSAHEETERESDFVDDEEDFIDDELIPGTNEIMGDGDHIEVRTDPYEDGAIQLTDDEVDHAILGEEEEVLFDFDDEVVPGTEEIMASDEEESEEDDSELDEEDEGEEEDELIPGTDEVFGDEVEAIPTAFDEVFPSIDEATNPDPKKDEVFGAQMAASEIEAEAKKVGETSLGDEDKPPPDVLFDVELIQHKAVPAEDVMFDETPALRMYSAKRAEKFHPLLRGLQRSNVVRDWEINFGPVSGPAGRTCTITHHSQILFRGEKCIATDTANVPGTGTRVMKVSVGRKMQRALTDQGTSTIFYPNFAFGNGMKWDTVQPGLSIIVEVSFVQACTFDMTVFGSAVQ